MKEQQAWACLLSGVGVGCLVASLVSGALPHSQQQSGFEKTFPLSHLCGYLCCVHPSTLSAFEAWVSTDKKVVYTDEEADTSLELYASFKYGLLTTKQAIWTETGKVLYWQPSYPWCDEQGTHSQSYYCLLLKALQYSTLVALLLAPLIIFTLATAALGNIRRRHARVVGLMVTLAVVIQLTAEGVLLYVWYRLLNDLNSDFDVLYPVIHGLQLSFDRAWYLAAGGAFATLLTFLMCSPYLLCCCTPSASRSHCHSDQDDEDNVEKPWVKERERFFQQL